MEKHGDPPVDGGEVIVTSQVFHNCAVNAILAAFSGHRTAVNMSPYQAEIQVTWVFRLLLAERFQKKSTVAQLWSKIGVGH